MLCDFSNKECFVSNTDVKIKASKCPHCGKKVIITFPKANSNKAKFSKHVGGYKK